MFTKKVVLLALATLMASAGACGEATAPKPKIAPTPVRLDVVQGANQVDTVVTIMALPIVTRALDASGNPVVGVAINYAVVDKNGVPLGNAEVNGFVSPPVEITNGKGESGANVHLGTKADSIIIKASYNDTLTHEEKLVKLIYGLAVADTVTTLQMVTTQLVLRAGDVDTVRYQAFDRYGNISGDQVSCQSADTTVAQMRAGCAVVANSRGQTVVTVTVRGIIRQVPVTVIDPYDAGEILYANHSGSRGQVYNLTTPARPSQDGTLIDTAYAYFTRLSPDRSKYAYRDASGSVFVSSSDGRITYLLTDSLPAGGGLSWSPNGSVLAVVANGHVYKVDALTGATLSSCGSGVLEADWSHDGGLFALVSKVGNLEQIFVTDTLCGNAVQLTSNGRNMQPRWSPDGAKIVFTSTRDLSSNSNGCTFGGGYIYLMSADGSNQTKVWGAGAGAFPSFSPTGNYLTFSANRGTWNGNCTSEYQLYIVSSTGLLPVQQTNDIGTHWMADWR